MYLATKIINGRNRFILRESYPDNGRVLSHDLFDLGEAPAAFIVYPGGNSFYFQDRLVETLADRGVTDIDQSLEKVLLPFLEPNIQRIIIQMTRLSRKRRVSLSREAMARAQARLHIFDRRRFFYLRFGRIDSPAIIMRPHRFLNVLVDKSRDETEFFFQKLEAPLRIREKKQYVFQTLDLARYFPGETARLFPLGLDQDKLDKTFLTELCRLNQDKDFLDAPGDPVALSEYLVRYAVMWFDYEFGQRPPRTQMFEEFVRGRRAYRPPPPAKALDLVHALKVFDLTGEEWRRMNRDDLSRVYRRLALTYHPDQGGDPDKFIELNLAYQRLVQDK